MKTISQCLQTNKHTRKNNNNNNKKDQNSEIKKNKKEIKKIKRKEKKNEISARDCNEKQKWKHSSSMSKMCFIAKIKCVDLP